MNVLEYLQKKYDTPTPTVMRYCEAKVFGIPYPLPKGWLAKYGRIEITDEMREKISKRLEGKIKNGGKRRKHLTHYINTAIDLLAKKSGPVTVTVFKNQKSKSTSKAKYAINNYVDPLSDEFLTSFQWRKLRLEALKLHGATCQCCGASPATGAVMNVDHVKPRKFFPHLALVLSNLQVLCGDCNHGKGNWDQTDWRPSTDESYDPLNELPDFLKK